MSRDTSYFVVTSRTLQVQILDKMVFDTGRRGRARVKVNQKSKETSILNVLVCKPSYLFFYVVGMSIEKM